jgi:hypothetical protein
VRFDSNASELAVNFTLTEHYTEYEKLMPIDGTSGLDLYAFDTNRSQVSSLIHLYIPPYLYMQH